MKKIEQLYRQIIMDHYKNPRNKGLKDDEHYVSDHIKNPSCGDDITIQTHVEDGIVTDIRHQGSGCSICCSSASVLSELLKGKTVERAEYIAENYLLMLMDKDYDQSIDFEDAVAFQGVKQFPARIKCATIAFKAFQNTLK
jgi:SUF system NifU family Fe-S assembly protein